MIGRNDSTPMEPYLWYCCRDHLLVCHCAFEARNTDVDSFIADSLRNLISLYHSGPSTVLQYFMSLTRCRIVLV